MKPPGQLRRTRFPVPVAADGTPRWSSLPARTRGLERTPLAVVRDAAQAERIRPRRRTDTIPPKVRRLVHARDERFCQHCGGHFPDGGIHQHHRRLKQAGGDPRPHTDDPCNLVSLCGPCHSWMHDTAEGRVKAEAEGFIIPNGTPHPGLLPVLLHGEFEGGGGALARLTCTGLREFTEPEGSVA